MKIQIEKQAFLEGLETVKGTVGKETHLPILKSVKITAEEGNLFLHTTNLATGTRVCLKKATVIEPGEALCDATRLLAIVKNLPESELKLATKENYCLTVGCGKACFTLTGLLPDEFPQAATPPEENGFDLGEEFFSSLNKVKNAASKDEVRFDLTGVYFSNDVVATDGVRLHLVKKTYPVKGIIVPLEFVNLILRLRKNGWGQRMRACCSDTMIFLYTKNLLVYSRLVDAEFPDYAVAIPQHHTRSATLEKEELSQVIRRVLLMSDKSNHIRCEFSENRLRVGSATPGIGEASEELEATLDPQDGKPFTIALNGRQVLDALETLEEDEVTFLLNGKESPLTIKEKASLYLLMPILVEAEDQEEEESEPQPASN